MRSVEAGSDSPVLAGARKSLSDGVAETLRSMILVGELMPGEAITHESVAERLGVSTMPVREALLRLAHEGFIDAKRSRTWRVAHTTREDIGDIYFVQGVLAGELTRRACAKHGDDLADELAKVHDQWLSLGSKADPKDLSSLNWNFHRTINDAADAPKLKLLLRNTLRFIPESFYMLVPRWRTEATRGHGQILEAIRDGDEQAARLAAEDHVHQAGLVLIEFYEDRGYWSEPTPQRKPVSRRR